jgi:acetylornithine deacetylase/succinyl-diaminopimelate desuccinylase-like protein
MEQTREGWKETYGQGASDLKGGCTAFIMALWFLSRTADSLWSKVVLTLVSDEETGGKEPSGIM